jgi:tryptophan halogenase
LFCENSWVQVMMGQGLMPGGYHNIADAMSDHQLKGFLAEIRSLVNQTVTSLSEHKAFIERYVSR